MITFKSVRWKNLLSTGNAWTAVNLDSHPTTLIIGENGAGKSTILDALCFGLFGKPFRNIKKDQLVNSVNNKQCLIEVEFEVGTKKYLVRRGIKPGKFEIVVNGVMMDRMASVRDQQAYLEQTILKLSYHSFTQIVILGNASFVPFMQLRAQERREIIEDLLDITIFTAMNELLKDRISSNKEKIQTAKYQLDLISEKLEVHQDHLKEMSANQKIKESKLVKEIEKANAFIAKTQKTIEKLDERIVHLDEKCEGESIFQEKLKKIDRIESQLEEKRKENKEKIKFYQENENCPECNQQLDKEFVDNKVKSHKETLSELEDGLAKLGDQVQQVTSELSNIAELVSEKNNIVGKKLEASASINQWHEYIRRVEDEVKEHKQDTGSIKSEKEVIKDLKKQTKDSSKSHEKLIHQKALYEAAWTLLRDAGIKTAIIRQYVPIINKLVNKYLSALEFFVQFELDEKFNEVIRSRYRDEFTYSSFSEGEKMRIDLALLFTWRAIAKMKNSTNTNLLILDEVFDASLDTSGCDEFLKLINQMGDGVRVFVISHKGDILADKFSETLKMEKYKNFSRIANA